MKASQLYDLLTANQAMGVKLNRTEKDFLIHAENCFLPKVRENAARMAKLHGPDSSAARYAARTSP